HVLVVHSLTALLGAQANNQGNIVYTFVSENECLCHGAQPTAEFAIGPTNSRESRVARVICLCNCEESAYEELAAEDAEQGVGRCRVQWDRHAALGRDGRGRPP